MRIICGVFCQNFVVSSFICLCSSSVIPSPGRHPSLLSCVHRLSLTPESTLNNQTSVQLVLLENVTIFLKFLLTPQWHLSCRPALPPQHLGTSPWDRTLPQTTSVSLQPWNVRLQRFHPKRSLEWAGGPICKIRVSGKLVGINFINNDFLQFPDLNREYCVKRGSLAPGQLDAGLPYCSSTEADLRRMKRELYSPGPM